MVERRRTRRVRVRPCRVDKRGVQLSVSNGARPAGPPGVNRPRLIGGLFAVLWAGVAAHLLVTLSGFATTSATTVHGAKLVYVLVGVVAAVLTGLRAHRVAPERGAWWCLTGSLALLSLGNLLGYALHLGPGDPPYPSWSDLPWTLYFLPTYAGIALLIRARLRGLPRAVALDGLVSGLGLATVVAGLLLGPILLEAEGPPLAVIVHVTYHVGDLILLALCVATLVMARGRAGPAWIVLIAGLSANAIAGTAHVLLVATGSYTDGAPLDGLWALAMASVALAAWQPPQPPSTHVPSRREHAVPALFTIAAVTLLASGALASAMPVPAVALAIATVLIAAVRVALVVRDVQNLFESRRLAESDELTGLLNRRGLSLRLETALQAVHGGSAVSLLLLDLNRFKEVNDTLGHHAGDQLLEEVARRLRICLPDTTLARLGGDEFVALLACDPPAALLEAKRLRAALDRPVVLDGLTTHTQASIGIACSPEHGIRRGDLLRHADVAMYRAKQRETGVELYAADGDDNSRQRLALVAELRPALADPNQIQLHYQPQLDLDSGQVRSVEALVRWQHPEHGLLTPDHFLELAEQHALMHALTLAVVDRALRQQRAWRRTGIELKVAVNVSAADLLDADFPDQLAALLRTHATPANALQLELTESTVMREPGRVLDTLAQLSELGVTLSLDDFGTGYSSLALLKRLPVQELKIDRSFVMDLLSDRDDAVIVRSTVDLGRSLGLRVVAEGVETAEHLERLRYFGSHLAQGYLISRPLPAVNVAAWLHGHQPSAFATRARPGAGATAPTNATRVLDPLLEVAGIIADGASLPTIFTALAERLRRLVPHDDLVVYGLDASDDMLSAVHADQRWVPETSRERFPATEGITGAVLQEGRMRNIARSDLDANSVRVQGTEDEAEALVSCPMAADGRPLGVLNVYRSGSWVPFSAEEASTIERFAAVASLAMRRDAPVHH